MYFQLNLVALNQPHTGLMMGANVADHMCNEQAKAMGLPFHYRAFISSHNRDLANLVHHWHRDTLPVTNLRVSLRPGRPQPEETLVVTRWWEAESICCVIDFCWNQLLFYPLNE